MGDFGKSGSPDLQGEQLGVRVQQIRDRALTVPASAWQNTSASDQELGPVLAFVRHAREDILWLIEAIGLCPEETCTGPSGTPPPPGLLTEAELIAMSRDNNSGPMAQLIANVEYLSDRLSDCWILLDKIGRSGVGEFWQEAEELLRRHRVPGWKTGAAQKGRG